MSDKAFTLKKAVPIIVLTWILSLVSTLAIVYFSPSIFSALSAEKIADNAIITTKLADGSVTSAKILEGTITAQDIADGSIITLKIADGAITTAKIADGEVTAAKIADNAIVTVKLADDSVTSEKIADGNVNSGELADGAVITSKIAGGAITTTKLADSAIVTIKLADGSVTSAKIFDGTITSVDLATGSVTTINIADFAVTNLKLAAGAIPFFYAPSSMVTSTDSTVSWVDMTDMSVTMSLERPSHLLIMFSMIGYNSDSSSRIKILASVGGMTASPGEITLTPYISADGSHDHSESSGLGAPYTHTHDIYNSGTHSHVLNPMAYSYNFYKPSVSAGTYQVKIQWSVTGGLGYAYSRTLAVIALPA